MKPTKSVEDYLEAIYVLSLGGKHARVKDIAKFLAIKLPSVTEAIARLVALDLVKHNPYGDVELTEQGYSIGKATWEKHQLLFKFFKDVLGVSETIAMKDACLAEHSISPETKGKIEEYMKYLKK
jgi:Mn-dependent DtxR family transcriptional regulator